MALQAQQTVHGGGGAGTGANLQYGHAGPPVNHPTLQQHVTGWENQLTGKREQEARAPSLATTPGTRASHLMPALATPIHRAPPATQAEKAAKLQALRGGNPRRHPGLPAQQGHASTHGAQTRKDTEHAGAALEHEVSMTEANERHDREQQARNQKIIAKFGIEVMEREEPERRARGQEIIAKFKAEVEARDARKREEEER